MTGVVFSTCTILADSDELAVVSSFGDSRR